MTIKHTTLLAAALFSSTSLIAAPAAGAKTHKHGRADLAMQRVTVSPKFVVLKPNGKPTAPVSVTVSIRNIGGSPAPPTDTSFTLRQDGRVLARDRISLPRLAAGHAATQIAIFHDVELQLGFMDAHASADSNLELAGSLTNDGKSTPDIPVIAQRWTGVMEADAHSPGILGPFEDDHASTDPEVTFTFSRLDSLHRFFYTVGGKVEQTTTFGDSQGCHGTHEGKASMARWGADSGLFLSQNLRLYLATLRGSLGPPFTVTMTCPNSPNSTPMTVKLLDLRTENPAGAGPLAMTPSQKLLHGKGVLGSIITLAFTWTLQADVP